MPLFNDPLLIQGTPSEYFEASPIGDGYGKEILFVPGTTVIPANLLNNSSNRNITTNLNDIMTEITYIGDNALSRCGNIFDNLVSFTLTLPAITYIGANAMIENNGEML
jgi:hypothetical protein